jgi:cyclic pyranopterin phosphate synthase
MNAHTATARLIDRLGRPLRALRLSVTDRCNLRCRYCMPETHYEWLPREQVLSFEEIERLVDAFCSLGVEKLRITGGEPLLRRDLHELVRRLAARPTVRDLALTTNGVLLSERAAELVAAGLHRATISLDTLRPETFRRLAGSDSLARTLAGVEAARAAGMSSLKLNAVVIRGVNDDELLDLLEFARRIGAELRYIEYMDVGGATQWSQEQVVSRREILERLAERFGPIRPLTDDAAAPAERFELADGTRFGVISSTTAPFCRTCDRSRLTADGQWYLCLYADRGIDLRTPLRRGAGREELAAIIRGAWAARADRGAEIRLREPKRTPLVPLTRLRQDVHLEMHTRGG